MYKLLFHKTDETWLRHNHLLGNHVRNFPVRSESADAIWRSAKLYEMNSEQEVEVDFLNSKYYLKLLFYLYFSLPCRSRERIQLQWWHSSAFCQSTNFSAKPVPFIMTSALSSGLSQWAAKLWEYNVKNIKNVIFQVLSFSAVTETHRRG